MSSRTTSSARSTAPSAVSWGRVLSRSRRLFWAPVKVQPTATHQGQGQAHRRHRQHPGPPGNEAHPLPQAALAALHGGGGLQQSGGRGSHGHQIHQGPAVGKTLPLAQAADGPLVAGQLAVPAGQHCRPPHQGVEPVQAQTRTPGPGTTRCLCAGGGSAHGPAHGAAAPGPAGSWGSGRSAGRSSPKRQGEGTTRRPQRPAGGSRGRRPAPPCAAASDGKRAFGSQKPQRHGDGPSQIDPAGSSGKQLGAAVGPAMRLWAS